MADEQYYEETPLSRALEWMEETLGYSDHEKIATAARRGKLTLRGTHVSDFERSKSEHTRMDIRIGDLNRMEWDWKANLLSASDEIESHEGVYHHHGYIDVCFIESEFRKVISAWQATQKVAPQAENGRPKKISDEELLTLIDAFEDTEIPLKTHALAKKIADKLTEAGHVEMSVRQLSRRINGLR